jgi:MoaA/NifB/PqqE/SkfB family radical SAM enzyme
MCLRKEQGYADSAGMRKDMDLGKFSELLAKFNKCIYVQFAGLGEPLLNKDIFKMMSLARERRKGIILYTNAAFLDQQAAVRICDLGVHRVNISLYGANPEEFFANTGSDRQDYYSVLDNISRLVRIKKSRSPRLMVSILYICSKRNIDDCLKVIDIGNLLGVDEIHFNNFNHQPFDAEAGKDWYLFEDDMEVVKTVARMRSYYSYAQVFAPAVLKISAPKKACPSYYKYINIDYEGNVAGCCKFSYPVKENGNIYSDKDIFNTDHFLKMRSIFTGKHCELPRNCKLCQEIYK